MNYEIPQKLNMPLLKKTSFKEELMKCDYNNDK